ncbi:hypothetical protein [Mangrovibacillus cuniculi]|uniref:Uncharacterized protein n=1 Tax=Mangrovibacillus cuniculi TaxID=2593652 RepID=A0A7S8CCM7_9BACI|nr:hypothetical protein [Mangrovibacillus cuniculi]QPC47549.1 hypothetical protein G8O30_11605 [Mangrovibacillus cuniculi]
MSKGIQYDNQYLLDTAKKHKEQFTSIAKWNTFAKQNDLPLATTYIKRFGTWNEVKESIGNSTNKQHRPKEYTDENLHQVINLHKEHFKTINHWNQYAALNNLPPFLTLERRLGRELIEEVLEKQFVIDDYGKILREVFPSKSPTVQEWTQISQEQDLPSTSTIIRHYGSWKKMKKEVYE